jgi:nucleoid-associated protein YgaU
MRRRSPILFIIVNVVISLIVAVAVISALNSRGQQESPIKVITVEVKITNTPDISLTIPVIIITATPQPGTPASIGALPTGILDTTSDAPLTPFATFDAQAIGSSSSLQGTATALPPNCILHTVQSGDTPFGIAAQYGADGNALMKVNGLNDETAALLQIGDVLIVPLEGCSLTAKDVATVTSPAVKPTATPRPGNARTATAQANAAEGTAEVTAEGTLEPTVRPTLTLPPTATNAQVEIVEVVGAGDVTAEGVVIRNVGNTINVKDWTLTDANGVVYTFSERVLFSNASVTVFTRVGSDTAIALFWNRNTPLFTPGNVLTLRDAKGTVQSTFRVTGQVNLP